jgi:DNA-binding PucR family transcriptional regulator
LQLRRVGVVPRVAAKLERGTTKVARTLVEAVLEEIAEFCASGNPEVLPELTRHAGEHTNEIRRLLGGGEVTDFSFVREHARRRAEQRFPLEATLHAYRCGHRVISHWLRDFASTSGLARGAIADFCLEYTNAISSIAAAEYVARTRALMATESDSRAELLDTLLRGFDEADGRVARRLRRAGYLQQRQAYCVVLAQSTEPLEMESPARVQRILDAICEAVAPLNVRALVGVRDNVAIAILSSTRRASGWTAPQTSLAERSCDRLLALGPAVLVGVSRDHPSTSFIPRARQEAAAALEFAKVSERVICFSALPVRRLLLRHAGHEVQLMLPCWADELDELDQRAHGSLSQTLRAYGDADMNVQKTAAALGVHPNTIYARLEKIRELTGRDAQRYHDLTELLLAMECRQP